MTRRMFGLKREAVKGDWIKLRNEEPRNLYSSSNKIILITCKNMRSVEDMACLGRSKNRYKVFVKDLEGTHSEDLGIDGRMIL
jgi:hypothetical protein